MNSGQSQERDSLTNKQSSIINGGFYNHPAAQTNQSPVKFFYLPVSVPSQAIADYIFLFRRASPTTLPLADILCELCPAMYFIAEMNVYYI